MRLLALDVGSKAIGCASSDPDQIVASPLTTIVRRGGADDLERVEHLARACDASGIVIGFPLDLRGVEGPAARRVRQFSKRVHERLNLPVYLWDERFSTRAAERALLEGNVKRRRRGELVDQVAAALILQSFLDARGAGAEAIGSAA